MQEPTKSTVLYGGKVKIDFYEGRHTYKKDGQTLISVTGCTGMIDKSRPLLIWSERLTAEYLIEKLKSGKKLSEEDILIATKLHATYKKEAADIGTKIHNFCELWIKHQLKQIKEKPEMPKEDSVLNGVLAFLKWVDEHKAKFISTEQIVYSKKFNFVGIADAFAIIDKKLTLVDFKSSASPHYPEYKFQVAGYRLAYEEESGKKIEQSIIAHFSKTTGEFAVVECPDYQKESKAFLACLTIKKTLKEYDKFN